MSPLTALVIDTVMRDERSLKPVVAARAQSFAAEIIIDLH